MTFDPKSLLGSQAFALAGGVVIGMGVFTLIRATIEHMIQPLFNLIVDHGTVTLSRSHGIHLGCAPFIGAGIVAVVCLAVGFLMIKASTR
jgi:large-conductance mechanosensitive channel